MVRCERAESRMARISSLCINLKHICRKLFRQPRETEMKLFSFWEAAAQGNEKFLSMRKTRSKTPPRSLIPFGIRRRRTTHQRKSVTGGWCAPRQIDWRNYCASISFHTGAEREKAARGEFIYRFVVSPSFLGARDKNLSNNLIIMKRLWSEWARSQSANTLHIRYGGVCVIVRERKSWLRDNDIFTLPAGINQLQKQRDMQRRKPKENTTQRRNNSTCHNQVVLLLLRDKKFIHPSLN